MPDSTLHLPDTSSPKAPAAPMAIALLKADHTNTAVLFDAFLVAKAQSNPLLKRALALQIAAELTVHATIEEEIFYPAARAALGEDEDLVDEAEQEHAEVKTLIAQLTDAVETLPLPAKVDTIVKKIMDAVLHHVEEEENELFPEVEQAGVDLAAIGLALSARKQELKDLISKEGRSVVASMVSGAVKV